ncbi:hypothetical protein K9N68_21805 [Kovacikia minuta CCNUW1]|uniref:hypothetical protein n=1 Tax=Kovacikia minuta TaxID=2931930 RepID=UPI001CCE5D39|nr:hypothetical protein [Kovacikia minuta]UBF24326.1 hypothetical protein K9N68_21805 [Kovacikia minuta CCNUW1]
MHYLKQLFVNTIALPSLAVLGACWVPAIAQANPQLPNQPVVIAKLLPKVTAYDCGSVGAITLTRDSKNSDRITYDAVNTRGQTLTLKNGVGYGDPTSTIYTFVAKDGSEFIIEEFPTGKATLTTSGKGGANSTSFNCTVTKAARTTSGEAAGSSASTSSESSSSVSETRTTVIRTTTISKPAPKPAPQPATGAVPALW